MYLKMYLYVKIEKTSKTIEKEFPHLKLNMNQFLICLRSISQQNLIGGITFVMLNCASGEACSLFTSVDEN